MQPRSDPAAGLTGPTAKGRPSATTAHSNGSDDGTASDLHDLLQALQAVRVGDFSVRLPGDRTGLIGKVADTFNDIVAANQRMSHELRTPLNSILILGQQLGENPDGNLTSKQVEFARTIHGAGTDLLNLISDILDLSKIESGTVSVDAEEIFFANLLDMVARPFRHEAEGRRLSFDVQLDPNLGRSIVTDSKRLQQVLKNLLSNAFKFTEHAVGALGFDAEYLALWP